MTLLLCGLVIIVGVAVLVWDTGPTEDDDDPGPDWNPFYDA